MVHVTHIPKTAIALHSGGFLDFIDIDNSVVTLDDIARGLSRVQRFAGQAQVKGSYTVAEHSLNVANVCPAHYCNEALFHDAAEAFMGDMPSPLKAVLPDYKTVEERVTKFIFKRLGLIYPIPSIIKTMDLRVLAYEAAHIMPRGLKHWTILQGVEPVEVPLRFREPAEAYYHFSQSMPTRFHPQALLGETGVT